MDAWREGNDGRTLASAGWVEGEGGGKDGRPAPVSERRGRS